MDSCDALTLPQTSISGKLNGGEFVRLWKKVVTYRVRTQGSTLQTELNLISPYIFRWIWRIHLIIVSVVSVQNRTFSSSLMSRGLERCHWASCGTLSQLQVNHRFPSLQSMIWFVFDFGLWTCSIWWFGAWKEYRTDRQNKSDAYSNKVHNRSTLGRK